MFSIFKQPLFKIMLLVAAGSFCLFPLNLRANTMSLTQTEIDSKITAIPQWQQKDRTLTRTFKFKNFVKAIAFVNQLVEPAEAAGHHPDIEISYNKVTISLTTHESGGITQMDFDLAQTISQLAQ
ncbi:4a-hydroxytetrahydrobiopterin dehydratase [Waterburya agarophytonicola]|nr:4a-hydroxytetrahydrobiopterin dehydratase [Waterburya agarophytonicola]